MRNFWKFSIKSFCVCFKNFIKNLCYVRVIIVYVSYLNFSILLCLFACMYLCDRCLLRICMHYKTCNNQSSRERSLNKECQQKRINYFKVPFATISKKCRLMLSLILVKPKVCKRGWREGCEKRKKGRKSKCLQL